jgi:hypothetical protein
MKRISFPFFCFVLGWIVRIYSTFEGEDAVGYSKLNDLLQDYPFVDLCNVTRIMELNQIDRPLFPMTWRFLPLLDPTVDILMPRDSDSHISIRESAAVNEWLLSSNSTFHIMRDHVFHCIEILGGKIIELHGILLFWCNLRYY